MDHMRRQGGHFDGLVGYRAVARDRRAVGSEQGDLGRGDRLERFGQRCGDREPSEQANQERDDRGKDAHRPPALAPAAPVVALPPSLAALFFGIESPVQTVETCVPIVIVERLMRRVIAPVARGFGLRLRLAAERIEYAHRLLC